MAAGGENFSVFVSKTLESIGYSWDLIKARREFLQQNGIGLNGSPSENFGIAHIAAGSRREGVCKLLGGDSDSMIVFQEIVATEHVDLYDNKHNMTVLELDLADSPPGYTLLTIAKHGGRLGYPYVKHDRARFKLQHFLESSLTESNSGKTCLSSKLFINGIENGVLPWKLTSDGFSLQQRAGPSLPSCIDIGFILSFDEVYSITCHCPTVFESFLHRRRQHGWPPEHLLQELSQLEAHVVPVGHKRSPAQFLEWRICFTKAEIRLIEYLTEPQIHVFVLLKVFAKECLKDIWDVMTSYVMKNVILWMAELIPDHKFRRDTIVDRFLDCLAFLRQCIKTGTLHNYMISARNMLSHDTFVPKRRRVLAYIDECLQERGSCLLRSCKLKEAMLEMYTTPESAVQYGMGIDMLEKAHLRMFNRHRHSINPTLSLQDMLSLVAPHVLTLARMFADADVLQLTEALEGCDSISALKHILDRMVSHFE